MNSNTKYVLFHPLKEKDGYRQKFLENNEYKVIRCKNSEVKKSLEDVLERLLKELEE
ncbi:endonuclease domain-containing protein [bacterium]|nr:endonuclease domain-containing protein [bacterium]